MPCLKSMCGTRYECKGWDVDPVKCWYGLLLFRSQKCILGNASSGFGNRNEERSKVNFKYWWDSKMWVLMRVLIWWFWFIESASSFLCVKSSKILLFSTSISRCWSCTLLKRIPVNVFQNSLAVKIQFFSIFALKSKILFGCTKCSLFEKKMFGVASFAIHTTYFVSLIYRFEMDCLWPFELFSSCLSLSKTNPIFYKYSISLE